MGMKYSFDARFELARRLSATFQRSASNCSMPIRWSAVIRHSFTLHTLSMSICVDHIQRRIPWFPDKMQAKCRARVRDTWRSRLVSM